MQDVGAGKGPGATLDEPVIVGKVVGLHGVRGWVKVYSYTRPPENILQYDPWWMRRNGAEWEQVSLRTARQSGKGIIASFVGFDDRDKASALMSAEIAVAREQLPVLPAGEYYWAELIGMRVETAAGEMLGCLDHFMETGAHDVMVVRDAKSEREHLIPFAQGRIVLQINRDDGVIRVDWQSDF